MFKQKNNFAIDLWWYFLGTGIPALIVLLRTPIYTRLFTPEDFGNYTLVFITFNYLSIVLFSWLGACIYRYYNQFKDKGTLPLLFSSILSLFLPAILFLILFALVWVLVTDHAAIQSLIIWGSVFVFLSQLKLLLIIPQKVEGKSAGVNVILSLSAVVTFLLLLILTFVLNFGIESFFISAAAAELAFIFFLLYKWPFKFRFSVPGKNDLKQLVSYGAISIIANLGAMLLIGADRYVINIYSGASAVGIYNQIYSITQMGIQTLILIFFNAINPVLLKELSKDKLNADVLKQYMLKFLLIFIPVTLYFSIYSKHIAEVLLGEEFRTGYTMIPLISACAFIGGMVMFYELILKFRNSYKAIALVYLLAVGINVLANIVFIPLFNYKVAALISIISYAVLLLGFSMASLVKLSFKDFFERNITRMLVILGLQLIIHYSIAWLFNSVIYSIVEGIAFVFIYLCFSKDLFKMPGYEFEK